MAEIITYVQSKSSAPPPFSPTDIAGLQLWLKADAGVTLNGSTVSAWADQSGNGNDATQATASYQPTFIADWRNTKPAIQFDGSDDHFRVPTLNLSVTNKVTMFFVHYISVNQNLALFANGNYGANGSFFIYYISATTSLFMEMFHGGNYWQSKIIENRSVTPLISCFVYNKDAVSPDKTMLYDNASQRILTNISSVIDTGNFSNSNPYIGSLPIGGYSFNGKIAEVILYPSHLSDIDRQKVETYLNTKYAIY